MIASINPSTGEVIKTFTPSTQGEVQSAIQSARVAFPSWSRLNPRKRVFYFRRLEKIIQKEKKTLQLFINQEMGKPLPDAMWEIDDILRGIPYYCKELLKIRERKFPLPSSVYPKTDAKIFYIPHGVVGLVAPWNFPFWTPMINIIPILLAGNTLVYKPSEYTTIVGLKTKELFEKAGFPQGVIRVLVGGEDVGKQLVTSDIDKIYFTGSVAAGQDIAKNVGVKPVTLELGGNSAAIVCADADIAMSAGALVWSRAVNAGQCCSATKRIYVHRKIADRFVRCVVEKVKRLQPGKDYGPLIRKEARQTVYDRIQKSVRQKARLLYGGKQKSPGFWLSPAVVLYDKESTEVVCDETFGPVIAIKIVKNEKEAIKLANDSAYGLTGSVWTRNLKKGLKMTQQIDAGMVYVNEANFALPGGEYWGGYKRSGFVTTEDKVRNAMRRKVLVEYGGRGREYWY